jgi:preprotein translocase subunit SecA
VRGAQRSERFGTILARVAAASTDACRCTDLELLELSRSLRHRFSQGEDWQQCLPEAFAAVVEATRRATAIAVTDSQIIAGMNVLETVVVELRDGEGKGIAAILSAGVCALAGMRVHVVTLDDYLAQRDFLRARSVLNFLGIGTRLIGQPGGRDGIMCSEVIYGSYAGLISEYLEDNLAIDNRDQSKRDVAIVDEADSILIDEARCLVQILRDPGRRSGTSRFVQHSQIDCRETLAVGSRRILAECRVRDYFRGYQKLGGLTATASPASARFKYFYGMEVVAVPAAVPDTRKDRGDLWHVGTGRMLADLEMHVMDRHARGQPVLIRAGSSELCRELSARLAKRGMVHAVLQPEQADAEVARVMADAGKMGALTIVTETAGRGYGIKLGGDPIYAATEALGFGQDGAVTGLSAVEAGKLRDARDAVIGGIEAERARVVSVGGLVVLGAFQSGSERADSWARGLAGQRGEPGESQFYHSSEEYSIKNGWAVRAETRRNSAPIICDGSRRGRFFRSIFNDVYRNSEAAAFAYQRKMIEFDDQADLQNRKAYSFRQSLLDGLEPVELARWVVDIAKQIPPGRSADVFRSSLPSIYPMEASEAQIAQIDRRDAREHQDVMARVVQAAYERREEEFGLEGMRDLTRSAVVSAFDQRWPEYLTRLHDIYNKIPGGKDRKAKKVVSDLRERMTVSFDETMMQIKKDTIRGIFGK